jgi:hypothetical protein
MNILLSGEAYHFHETRVSAVHGSAKEQALLSVTHVYQQPFQTPKICFAHNQS